VFLTLSLTSKMVDIQNTQVPNQELSRIVCEKVV